MSTLMIVTIGIPSTFDLMGAGRGRPNKIGWERVVQQRLIDVDCRDCAGQQ